MARQARNHYTLPDGRTVGYGFKERDGVIYVQFADPDRAGKYVEKSTGARTKADAYLAAAKIVLSYYAPTIPADLKRTTWDTAVKELAGTTSTRTKTLVTYNTAINNLRAVLPDTKGPADITPQLAERFARVYAAGKFVMSNKPDAKQYPRSAQTVFGAIANLSIIWNRHFKPLGYVTSNPWENVKRPKLPKRAPSIPTDDAINTLFRWVEEKYPGWELMRLFITVKMLSGCRLNDLCQVRSDQLSGNVLTITPDQDKTHRERRLPLPDDVADRLHRIKGPTYLWERYTQDAKVYRPGPFNCETFAPKTMYFAVKVVFKRYGKAHPEAKVKTHDLRKRAITLTTLATQ